MMEESPSREVIIGAISVTIVFVILVVFIVSYFLLFTKRSRLHKLEKERMQRYFAEQLIAARLETQEETLSRIGKELHDNIGQMLNTAKLQLGLLERSASMEGNELLMTVEHTIFQVIKEVRLLTGSLDADWLEQFDFVDNLMLELDRIRATGLEVEVSKNVEINMNHERQLILFRIVQEVLQNTIKHSKATAIKVQMKVLEGFLHLRLADNGIGFLRDKVKVGMGTGNIKNRVHVLLGKVYWESVLSQGTLVKISIPLEDEHKKLAV